jgi:hypothetical protein
MKFVYLNGSKPLSKMGAQVRAAYVHFRVNRIQAIRVFAARVTPIFSNKTHALNT